MFLNDRDDIPNTQKSVPIRRGFKLENNHSISHCRQIFWNIRLILTKTLKREGKDCLATRKSVMGWGIISLVIIS